MTTFVIILFIVVLFILSGSIIFLTLDNAIKEEMIKDLEKQISKEKFDAEMETWFDLHAKLLEGYMADNKGRRPREKDGYWGF